MTERAQIGNPMLCVLLLLGPWVPQFQVYKTSHEMVQWAMRRFASCEANHCPHPCRFEGTRSFCQIKVMQLASVRCCRALQMTDRCIHCAIIVRACGHAFERERAHDRPSLSCRLKKLGLRKSNGHGTRTESNDQWSVISIARIAVVYDERTHRKSG